MVKKSNNEYICKYCGGSFIYIGFAPYCKYCSDGCSKLAQYTKIKKHKSKRLGTTELSAKRNKDFKRELEIVGKERKRLHLA